MISRVRLGSGMLPHGQARPSWSATCCVSSLAGPLPSNSSTKVGIGDVVSIATRRVGNVRDQDVLRGRTSIPLYYGVHDLDIVRWFAGANAVSIQAVRRSGILRAAGFDIDDLYCAILGFDNGALATAELGWHIPRERHQCAIIGHHRRR